VMTVVATCPMSLLLLDC